MIDVNASRNTPINRGLVTQYGGRWKSDTLQKIIEKCTILRLNSSQAITRWTRLISLHINGETPTEWETEDDWISINGET